VALDGAAQHLTEHQADHGGGGEPEQTDHLLGRVADGLVVGQGWWVSWRRSRSTISGS
jgi:hypothetical protein